MSRELVNRLLNIQATFNQPMGGGGGSGDLGDAGFSGNGNAGIVGEVVSAPLEISGNGMVTISNGLIQNQPGEPVILSAVVKIEEGSNVTTRGGVTYDPGIYEVTNDQWTRLESPLPTPLRQ